MATEEKPAPANPWNPVLFLILIIGGSLFILYMRGDLGKLNGKDLFVPPPPEAQTTKTSGDQSGTTYAEHDLLQNAYTMDPNPIDTTNPNSQ